MKKLIIYIGLIVGCISLSIIKSPALGIVSGTISANPSSSSGGGGTNITIGFGLTNVAGITKVDTNVIPYQGGTFIGNFLMNSFGLLDTNVSPGVVAGQVNFWSSNGIPYTVGSGGTIPFGTSTTSNYYNITGSTNILDLSTMVSGQIYSVGTSNMDGYLTCILTNQVGPSALGGIIIDNNNDGIFEVTNFVTNPFNIQNDQRTIAFGLYAPSGKICIY